MVVKTVENTFFILTINLVSLVQQQSNWNDHVYIHTTIQDYRNIEVAL